MCREVRVDMHACMCAAMRVDTCVDMHVDIWVDIHIGICVDMCIYVCVTSTRMCEDMCPEKFHRHVHRKNEYAGAQTDA